MNRTWVEARKAEIKEKFEAEKKRLKKEICEFGRFFPGFEKNILQDIDSLQYYDDRLSFKLNDLALDLRYGWRNTNLDAISDYTEWYDDILKYENLFQYCVNLDKYLDSEPVEFDGDIIITDPCYIMRTKEQLTDNDWHSCCCGSQMEALGIKKHITRDTLYGDWSCTTYNSDTGEVIGEFCADAGLVSVFDLDEVLKYNPEFSHHKDCPWSTTLIKDFKGVVQFVVVYTDGYYESETKYHKKGDHWEDYSVEVVGHGINKVTGAPINFIGKQTGF